MAFLARRLNGNDPQGSGNDKYMGPVCKDFFEGTYSLGDDTRKPSWLTFAPELLLTPAETLL